MRACQFSEDNADKEDPREDFSDCSKEGCRYDDCDGGSEVHHCHSGSESWPDDHGNGGLKQNDKVEVIEGFSSDSAPPWQV